MLKVEPPLLLPPLKLADSELLRQGQMVLAFGNPLGLENSVSLGVVSSVGRQIRPDDPMVYIQTDAPINPGNSGGPLLDAEATWSESTPSSFRNRAAARASGSPFPATSWRTSISRSEKTGMCIAGRLAYWRRALRRNWPPGWA